MFSRFLGEGTRKLLGLNYWGRQKGGCLDLGRFRSLMSWLSNQIDFQTRQCTLYNCAKLKWDDMMIILSKIWHVLGLFCFMMMCWYDDHHMIAGWSSYDNMIVIIWQEWQTRISYLITLSPSFLKILHVLGLFCFMMIWWSSYDYMMTRFMCKIEDQNVH